MSPLSKNAAHTEVEMKRCPKCGYKELPSMSLVRAKLGTQPKAKRWQGDRDLEAMKRLKDPRSYIRLDKSEVLYGEDWRKRRLELLGKSYGMCERLSVLGKLHVAGCDGYGTDPHHIKKRWPRRDDRLENLAALSRACHRAEDPRHTRFGEKK